MLKLLLATLTGGAFFSLTVGQARAETHRVGPGATYATPCAAFTAASDGDTILIEASGRYDGDVCAITRNGLTIRGLNGRAHVDAAGAHSGGKAIWVVQGDNTVVEDIELSGCKVPDANGAGIRQEGKNLTVRRGYFHDNQNGILTSANPYSVILIEDSEFANNGAGDGQSHNLYIGEVLSFTLRGSYSHHAKVGHLVKSRALRNEITYNRLTDEDGSGGHQLDLPQGGSSYVIGNVLQKSASSQSNVLLSYAREQPRNADSSLWVVNNTFHNQRENGTFVDVPLDVGVVVLRNNIFLGKDAITENHLAVREANLVREPSFVSAASYDYQLQAASRAIDRAIEPGDAGGRSLAPQCHYTHPARATRRAQVGDLDQGAMEYDGGTTEDCYPVTMSAVAGPEDASVAPPLVQDGGRADSDAGMQRSDAALSSNDAGAQLPQEEETEMRRRRRGGCQLAEGVVSFPLEWSAMFLLALLRRRPRRATRP
jgi:hypothetical protein